MGIGTTEVVKDGTGNTTDIVTRKVGALEVREWLTFLRRTLLRRFPRGGGDGKREREQAQNGGGEIHGRPVEMGGSVSS